jgi:UTP:GlnB (protein PII) uridylyltransferase
LGQEAGASRKSIVDEDLAERCHVKFDVMDVNLLEHNPKIVDMMSQASNVWHFDGIDDCEVTLHAADGAAFYADVARSAVTADGAVLDAAVDVARPGPDDTVFAVRGAADGAALVAAGTRCEDDAQRRMVAAARGRLGPYRTEEYAVQKRHMEHILSEFGVMPTVDAFASRANARFPRFWTKE